MSYPRIFASLSLVAACTLGPAALADDRHGGGGYYGGGQHGGGHHGGGYYGGGHHGGHNDHWSGNWVIGIPWGYGAGYGYGYGPGYGAGYGYAPYGYGYGVPYGYPGPYERRVIIERERVRGPEVSSGPPPEALWYYCDSAGAYYPYVSSCPEPWRQVPAQPPEATGEQRR